MREVLKTHERTSQTSVEKFGNYSREVLQPDEWQIFAPAVHMAKKTRPSGKLHTCSCPTSRVKFVNFSAEVFQLLVYKA